MHRSSGFFAFARDSLRWTHGRGDGGDGTPEGDGQVRRTFPSLVEGVCRRSGSVSFTNCLYCGRFCGMI